MGLLKHFFAAAALMMLMAASAFAGQNPAEGPVPTLPSDLAGPPIDFFADLSDEDATSVVHSPGTGHVALSLDRKTLRFSWKLTFSGLTSRPTAVHLHGPQTPGGNAGVLID